MSEISVVVAGSAETLDATPWEDAIIEITKALVRNHLADEPGFGLGGHWSYLTWFENDVMRLHPFCWCEEDDCGYCSGREPNFWHKPSGIEERHYKYLGRETEMSIPADCTLTPHDVLVSCLGSIGCDLSELDKPEPICTCNDDDGTYTIDCKQVDFWTFFNFCMEHADWKDRTTSYFPEEKRCDWCKNKEGHLCQSAGRS